MPVTSVTTDTNDPQSPTLTIVADSTASLRRLWDAYTDPRQIEKFWDRPPTPPPSPGTTPTPAASAPTT